MSFTKLTKDMGIIAKLDDEPNDVGGLTSAQLKEKFDEGGQAVKDYLNDTLLTELADPAAAAALGAVLDGEGTTVQAAMDVLRNASMKSGNVPVGGAAGHYLRKRTDETYDSEWVPLVLSCTVTFAAGDWTQGESGCTLTIPRTDHGRESEAFACVLSHRVDGVLTSGTWAAVGTRCSYDADTGAITLTSGEAYDGAAVFYG